MKTKLIISILMSLVVAVLGGVGLSAVFETNPLPFVFGLFLLSFVPMPQMGGIAMGTFYRQVWEKEAVKSVDASLKDTFLDGIPDKSRYVVGNDEMQTINSMYFGVEPDVLINNTTYPIPLQELDGTPFAITLDKYQTKVTPITDDELYALAYDKIKEVKLSHTNAIAKNRLKKAIHALAPADHAAAHPVIVTTGATTPDGLRKRLKWDDVVTLREKWVAAEFALEDLRLVLCPDHVNDLLLADTSFTKSYANFKDGIITKQLGFEIREYSKNPYYTVSTLTKQSFGAVPTGTERMASVVFNKGLARKAKGVMKVYYDKAETNPRTQQNEINFRNYFICLPSVNQEIGAIVSDIPA